MMSLSPGKHLPWLAWVSFCLGLACFGCLGGCAGRVPSVESSPDDEKQIKSLLEQFREALATRNWTEAQYLVDPQTRSDLGPCLSTGAAFLPKGTVVGPHEMNTALRPVPPKAVFSHMLVNGLFASAYYRLPLSAEQRADEDNPPPRPIFIVALRKTAEGWRVLGPFSCGR